MEKLYYKDRYLKDFTAEVVEVIEKDGYYHVVLDKTAFFPGGGGQPNDLGTIDKFEILDVYEENDIIYHVLNKKPLKIHNVKCKIDWKRRFDGMQQHLGQHVLSGCFFSLFNANTVSFHLGSDVSTVDITGYLEEEQIRKAETMANSVVMENIEVELLFPNKSTLKKLNLRRDLPKNKGEITVVKIGDLDINACCGVHPKSTLDLGLIKVKRWEKHKDATRIEFLAGNRAVEDYFKKATFTNKICKFLNCGEKDAINAINNLSNSFKEAQGENRELKNKLGDYEIKDMLSIAEVIGDFKVVKEIYDGTDIKYVSKIAEKIVKNDDAIVLFLVKNQEKTNLIFSASRNIKGISMNELLKDSITLIDGKGGGSEFLAQGAGKNNNNTEMVLDYVIMKLKQCNEK